MVCFSGELEFTLSSRRPCQSLQIEILRDDRRKNEVGQVVGHITIDT
uniref:Uncharacterized protein n=1 Tax=Rhizobium rhizogenes TaxID=359 RepID=A0A7S4ZSX6_RHIRH|nr:hypothetical protein pC6.5d_730 [Rhizobium rhizogenes]